MELLPVQKDHLRFHPLKLEKTKMGNLQNKDQQLWEEAGSRVKFKRRVVSYIITNAFFWILWYVGGAQSYGFVPWPVWPMLGWGIGLAFEYFRVYRQSSNAIE